ncbi:hypothetical protein Mal64_15670 [Pseudobythopirellula maris]|uniref:Bacterial type II and III secretion system protein n=1 Tax=Pseudobythopirellula maris TaxID=2527991 RepID=A0A5C5ZLP3_9BACT|nr:hypothetical protein [Pseudobythopirellula maris]TWT88095.1 hypothetical protein Mal64_15670 [Pseudobythopirellula maris]
MLRAASRTTLLAFCAAVALVLSFAAGCQMIGADQPVTTKSLLKAAQPSPDAVTIEIYWATLPVDVDLSDQGLWRFVQEDRLPTEQRARLMRNGLRAGVVGGAPPEEIVDLLDPGGAAREGRADNESVAAAGATGVSRRVKQVRLGERVEIQASQPIDEVPLLIARGDELTGQTFRNAQAIYALEVARRDDGRYAVSLTPELHFGAPKMRFIKDETGLNWRQAPLRERETFGDSQVEAPLVVGEMLIATSLVDAGSRLGEYFHRPEEGAEGGRKAILVRLVQAPLSEAFTADRS